MDNNGGIIRYMIETVPIEANLQVRIIRYLIATVSIDVKTMPIPIGPEQSPSKETSTSFPFPAKLWQSGGKHGHKGERYRQRVLSIQSLHLYKKTAADFTTRNTTSVLGRRSRK